ncbi:MAG: response regulator [Eubacteriales bacterium]|nr:response regulator [Eubacteriales bacterium]
MFKLLVAEDEAILREGVRDELRSTGFFAVDTAANGEEALALALKNEYDAIILDIRMPKLDGMKLLAKLAEENNEAFKIIMSGYSDFIYAKKGIQYGVSDYVVKPLSPDGIRKMGEKLYRMIHDRNEEKHQVKLLEAQVQDTLPVFCDMIFSRMISGEYSSSAAEEKLSAQGVKFEQGGLRAVIIFPVNENERPDKTVFRVSVDSAVAIFGEQEETALSYARDFIDKSPPGAICAISDEQSGPERLRDAYLNAEEALKYAQLLEMSGTIFYGDIKSTGSNIYLDELDFRVMLGFSKKEELISSMDRLFEDIPLNTARQDYYSLAIYIAMLCQNNVFRLSPLFCRKAIDFEEVLKARTLKSIKAWTFGVISWACDQISELTQRRSGLEVEKTKQYIEEHLSEDISMADLAGNAYLSPNYLGKLFMERLGISVSEYINRRRIEKACEAIRGGNAKIYEIAESVGIRDPNYFSSLFRKIMGISPKEYRSLICAQEQVRQP